MVYCAGKLIENLKLFYKSDRPHFLGFPGVITHLGCWENTRKVCKSRACVLPTSRVGYHAGKPIESVVYFLNNEPSLLPLLPGLLAQLLQRCTSIPRYL